MGSFSDVVWADLSARYTTRLTTCKIQPFTERALYQLAAIMYL